MTKKIDGSFLSLAWMLIVLILSGPGGRRAHRGHCLEPHAAPPSEWRHPAVWQHQPSWHYWDASHRHAVRHHLLCDSDKCQWHSRKRTFPGVGAVRAGWGHHPRLAHRRPSSAHCAGQPPPLFTHSQRRQHSSKSLLWQLELYSASSGSFDAHLRLHLRAIWLSKTLQHVFTVVLEHSPSSCLPYPSSSISLFTSQ